MDGNEGQSVQDIADSLEASLDDNGWMPDDPEYGQTEEPAPKKPKREANEPEPKEEPEGEPAEEDDEEVEGEGESEEDPEDQSEEDEEGDDEEDPKGSEITDETLVDIKIGDDDYEVNFAELKSGYLRNEDYVTKVQAHEAEYQEKTAQTEQLQAQLAEELQHTAVIALGDLQKYDRINWPALKEADPAKYNELRVEATEAREAAQALVNRRDQIKAMHQKAQQLRHEAYVKGQVALAEKLIPEFRDPEFFKSLVKYGKEVGYTEDDITNISDARQLLLLNNARLYAEGVVRRKNAEETKRPKAELPPVVKPGQKKSANAANNQKSKVLSARAKSDGSVESAAAYLETLDLD